MISVAEIKARLSQATAKLTSNLVAACQFSCTNNVVQLQYFIGLISSLIVVIIAQPSSSDLRQDWSHHELHFPLSPRS
jgi:hypothetical protein